jgi:predicted ATPase
VDINIIVGANGAGKSNFLSFFKLASALAQGNLQVYIQQAGRARCLVVWNSKNYVPKFDMEMKFFHPQFNAVTIQIRLKLLRLIPTVDNRQILFMTRSEYGWYGGVHDNGTVHLS